MTTIRTGNRRRLRAERRRLDARFGYTITDCRPIAAENPHSFYIPCEARLNAIAPGDFVKLVFEPTHPGFGPERMWVAVTKTDGENLEGVLANQPIGEMGIGFGSKIRFKRFHVITIETERADDPEETNVQDPAVFFRCLMDARVYNDKIPVVRMVRDAEQPADYGLTRPEMFPWGGWRLVGEGFKDGMPTEIGTPVIAIRAGAQIADLLHAPEGTAFDLVEGEWRKAA